MKKLCIEMWPVEKLIPYPNAIRKNDHAVRRMISLIQEFGFKLPLLIRGGGEIVDGHLRWKAAKKLELAEVPVIRCDEWSEAQVKAFRLAVNRSASWAEWDLKVLTQELADLQELNFDLALTGFDQIEIERLLPTLGGDDTQPPPASAAQVVTVPGDLWVCGKHRVLCGDATSASDVVRLLASATPILMVTDPPYGVDYDPLWREEAGLGKQRQTGTVANDNRVDWAEAYKLFPGDVAYVWHAGVHAAEVARSLATADFEIRSQIIWAKQHFAMSRGHYHWQHEPCWYAVRTGRSGNWAGSRKETTLWEVANLNPFGGDENEGDAATGHSTQKPTELMRRPMLNHTEEEEIIYDPFLGSGSTLIAAEQLKRICYGLEIEPKYVDMIVERWQKLRGKEAILEADGRGFEQIRTERRGGTKPPEEASNAAA